MIKVTFYYNDEFKIKGFELKGHANYGEFGYDILCAAATTNSIGVINSLEELQNVCFDVQEDSECFIAAFIKDDDIEKSQLLLNHLKRTLEEFSREYPKNIKIYEK